MGGVSRVFVLLIFGLSLVFNTVEVDAKSTSSHSSHHSSSHHSSPSHHSSSHHASSSHHSSPSHSTSHNSGHSYPSSTGHSGNSHIAHSSGASSHSSSNTGSHSSSSGHSYPSSSGNSGTGSHGSSSSIQASHINPSSNSPSSSHSTSSGHSYPSSSGHSGTGSQGTSSHNSNSHRYSETNKLSGGGSHYPPVTTGHQKHKSNGSKPHTYPKSTTQSSTAQNGQVTHVTSRPSYPLSFGKSGIGNTGNRTQQQHPIISKHNLNSSSSGIHNSSTSSHGYLRTNKTSGGSNHTRVTTGNQSHPFIGSNPHTYPKSTTISGTVTSRPSYPLGNTGNRTQQQHPIPSKLNLNNHTRVTTGNQSRPFNGSQPHTYPKSTTISGTVTSRPSYPLGNTGNRTQQQHPIPSKLNLNNHTRVTTGNQSRPFNGSQPHTYPKSTTISGTVTSRPNYPLSSGKSETGNTGNRQPTQTQNTQQQKVHHTTVHHHHHHHYYYSPPSAIYYTTTNGVPTNFPVYRGPLPDYVYTYKSSGSRYSNLLSGLALYNLGKTSSNSHFQKYHKHYKPNSNELCKFGVQYDNGNHEEMNIDCHTITRFIWAEQSAHTNVNNNTITNQTVITTHTVLQTNISPNGTLLTSTVPPVIPSMVPQNVINLLPNGTVVNVTIASNNSQVMLPNGTLVPSSISVPQVNNNMQVMQPNGTLVVNTKSVVTTTNTEVIKVSDNRFKGDPVIVTPGMICYVIRSTPSSFLRKTIPCGLLETYAKQSLRTNSAVITKSSFPFTCVFSVIILLIFA